MNAEPDPEVELINGSFGIHFRQTDTDLYFTFYQKDSNGVWSKEGEAVLSKGLTPPPVSIDNFG